MDWRDKYLAFKEWQRQPHQVAPLSEEERDCPTCGTHFKGNYCPRCGQSAKIGRYSFTKAFLLFLDVWGLGNRGMFRSLRDLILRPGYMIRDYLGGMQMAYFPPFKMFFLLTTLSLLITNGMNIKGIDQQAQQREEVKQGFEIAQQENVKTADQERDKVAKEAEALFYGKASMLIDKLMSFQEHYPNIFSLTLLTLVSGLLFIFFRKSPSVPDMHYSEFLVGLIYVSNMLSIYSNICDFLCLDDRLELFFLLTGLIAMKQWSGYGWLRTIWSTLVPFVLLAAIALLIIIGIAMFVGIYYYS